MRSSAARLACCLTGSWCLIVLSTGAGADPAPPTTDTTIVSSELAPGESPGGLSIDPGPTLTMPIPTTSVVTEPVEPAGPLIRNNTFGDNGADSSVKAALLLVMLTAVPSLTLGTALWIQRGDARSRSGANARRR